MTGIKPTFNAATAGKNFRDVDAPAENATKLAVFVVQTQTSDGVTLTLIKS